MKNNQEHLVPDPWIVVVEEGNNATIIWDVSPQQHKSKQGEHYQLAST